MSVQGLIFNERLVFTRFIYLPSENRSGWSGCYGPVKENQTNLPQKIGTNTHAYGYHD